MPENNQNYNSVNVYKNFLPVISDNTIKTVMSVPG